MSFRKRPVLFAYAVHSVDGRDVWEQIGAAFAHEGRTGFNVVFDKMPARDASGRFKIVLRGGRSSISLGDDATQEAPAAKCDPHKSLPGGGGVCDNCNGTGIYQHRTRGPRPCPTCRPSGGA